MGPDATAPSGAGGLAVTGLSSDSRAVKQGYVFAALPGSVADGAAFIPQAVQAGAIAVIARPGTAASVPVIASNNPRRLYARLAARFYGAQPDLVVAVTGTNGKTSVASFVREIWSFLGFRAASLGTIGVVSPAGTMELAHTTPDPAELHEIAAKLAEDHVDHLAIEASSHGLAQYRLDGLRLAAGGFTNLSRDHLDYHPSLEAYFDAKMRLFEELLPPGAAAVINTDGPYGAEVARRAAARGLRCLTVGRAGKDLTLLTAERDSFGQRLAVKGPSSRHDVLLPLVGDFQTANALVAAGLAIATGAEEELVFRALESLKGAKGRLDLVARGPAGAPVFVDYAHTPDALENAIVALRPYVKGRLAVVFGCGGDRDRGKRPLMGAIAARLADRAIVTDDNPRTEEAAKIRAEIMVACPGAREIGNRAEAIRTAVAELKAGDILLIAGKGHEEGQKIGKTIIPFSDHEAVRAAVAGADDHG
ncbi:MAG: UDP-N-acetylmuramoyl-L-alanyl-D-glutamate--2,6-diaminopimelate ligase [Rhizobiales bacterium]|nr:UDP-N-acetylmuramoyl-L-alanyl-D-glutamate--2,6-diaminopimelate ligase [Hyphomicrobiales bacterium]MBI3672881.1 UDP-N-acetylmuramoyl-L-alanyl-D-glutamate--2,6-diaminopimelate ligase [Hyphomicrobiales bacterium]